MRYETSPRARVSGVQFVWSSADAGIGAIDAAGLARAVAHGSTTITAQAGAALGSATLDVHLTASVATVTVSPATARLAAIGATQQYEAIARDAQSRVLPGVPFAWTSDAPAVATVDSASGLATAIANGTATITATSGGIAGSAGLEVQQVVASIVVSPADVTVREIEAVVQFNAEALDSNGHVVSGVVFTWSSTDPAVAKVNATTGRAESRGWGTVLIRAAAHGVTGSAYFAVVPD